MRLRAIGRAVVIFCAAGAVDAPAQPMETAVNCVEGSVVDLAYSQHASGCGISPISDIDQFRFCGAAGDAIRFVLAGADGSLDLRAELFGSGPTPLAQASCDAIGVGTCAVVLDASLPDTGCYTMAVSDPRAVHTGAYVPQLERRGPPFEPYLAQFGQSVSSRLDPISDTDTYAFSADAGANVRLIVAGMDGSLDLRARVLTPEGTEVTAKACDAIGVGTCAVTIDLTIPERGGSFSSRSRTRRTSTRGDTPRRSLA